MPHPSRPGGPSAAELPAAPPPTERHQLDESVARLRDGARRFAALTLDGRLALARAMRSGYARVAPRSVELNCRAKRILLGTPLEGEEWALGPWPVLRHFRLLIEALDSLRRRRETPIGEVSRTVDGRLAIEVFPGNALDSVLLPGARAEVHLRAGVSEMEMHASRARLYRQSSRPDRVVLILPAGNAAAVPCQDVLSKLFNEGAVCLLKMHPVNAYLGPLLEQAFGAAIEQDFLRIVYGGAEAGAYLCRHPGIDDIHLTGSSETHERLLWGEEPTERAARKAEGHPIHAKRITSALGNVSPVLIVPGPYLDRQLAFQAEALAGSIVNNAGCNCTTPRLIVTPRGWAQRGVFLHHLEAALERAPLRLAYYPGAVERWEWFSRGRADVRFVGAAVGGMLPWTLIPGLDPTDRREPLFTMESFCPVVGETEVGSTDPLEYLQQAVGFVNERVWGTLSVTLLVHPRTLADRQLGPAVERAIAQLRYGAVGVNVWPALLCSIGAPPWGAHPSSTVGDIQSGRGWVHNTSMLEEIEKAVLRQPLTTQLKPWYSAGHRSAHLLLRRLAAVERGAGWAGLPGVLEAAMRA